MGYVLKHVTDGKMGREDEEEIIRSYWQHRRKKIPEIEGGSTRSHSLEKLASESVMVLT